MTRHPTRTPHRDHAEPHANTTRVITPSRPACHDPRVDHTRTTSPASTPGRHPTRRPVPETAPLADLLDRYPVALLARETT